MKLVWTIGLVATLPLFAKEPVDWVNPEIGNISHLLVPTFPTASRPNGMMRFNPPQ